MSERRWGPLHGWQMGRTARDQWLFAPPGRSLFSILAHLGTPGYDQGANRDAESAGIARDGRMARLEAVLFVVKEALPSRRLAQFASLADATEARTLIGQLNELYELSGSAFRVEEVAGGYRLLTRPQFGGWLRRIHRVGMDSRLSAPALETLAVVAYRQPVMRSEIEAIRGVQCGEMLRQLMDRDFVKIVGRSKELGRPFIYGTTKHFLEMYGLRSLEDLPRAAELRSIRPDVARGDSPKLFKLHTEENTTSYSSDQIDRRQE